MDNDYRLKELEYLKEQREERRKSVSKVSVEFLGGTNIEKACKILYDMHMESGADMECVFNDVHIRMMNNDLKKKLGK